MALREWTRTDRLPRRPGLTEGACELCGHFWHDGDGWDEPLACCEPDCDCRIDYERLLDLPDEDLL